MVKFQRSIDKNFNQLAHKISWYKKNFSCDGTKVQNVSTNSASEMIKKRNIQWWCPFWTEYIVDKRNRIVHCV